MNKVIVIHLAGHAYHLEEPGYHALQAYLDNAARQLAANPDREEILADIEAAIAEKCRALLNAHCTVVVAREIARILAEMGPVTDSSASGPATGTESTPPGSAAANAAPGSGATSGGPAGDTTAGRTATSREAPRHIYLLPEGALFGGVCNGLAAYFGVHVALVRVLFVFPSFFTFGAPALVYLLLMFTLPTARTPEEKAAAHGAPSSNAQEFIRRAREGYYRGLHTFQDKESQRAWKRKFRREMRSWRHQYRHGTTHPSQSWHQSWQQSWSGSAANPPRPASPGTPHPDWSLWLGAPFFAVLKTLLTLTAFFAIFSLIATGQFFSHPLPPDVPVWIAVVGVIIVYQLLAMPFHAVRYAYRASGGCDHRYSNPFAAFFGSLFGLALLGFGLWMIDRHVPGAHAAFQKIPPALNSLLAALKDWWSAL